MKTGSSLAGREPDLLFVSKGHLHRLKETYLEGPADLIIEIVSAESRASQQTQQSWYIKMVMEIAYMLEIMIKLFKPNFLCTLCRENPPYLEFCILQKDI